MNLGRSHVAARCDKLTAASSGLVSKLKDGGGSKDAQGAKRLSGVK